MNEYQLISNYQNNAKYRMDFNRLAQMAFGIDFARWYELGFWNDSYICYSYLFDDSIVANVSVNKLSLIIDGVDRKGLLIGTVMTRPDFRGKGLSKALMEFILKKYDEEFDLIYLFANKSAVDFYPRFGFRPYPEVIFKVDGSSGNSNEKAFRKLDISKSGDLDILKHLVSNRIPVSRVFGVKNGSGILFWYCLNVFREDIYYLQEEDAIVLYKTENGVCSIYDIVSKTRPDIMNLIRGLLPEGVREVVFHFTPDDPAFRENFTQLNGNDQLFVRTKVDLPEFFKYPITAQA